jgi:predicted GIY-YIG superfamily endonuclease
VHFVYIVRCADGTLYTGYARDPDARAKAHNNGRGARYTSGRRPVVLVYMKACRSKGDALRREYRLKRLRREAKEALIAKADAGRRKPRGDASVPPAKSSPAGTRPRAR